MWKFRQILIASLESIYTLPYHSSEIIIIRVVQVKLIALLYMRYILHI